MPTPHEHDHTDDDVYAHDGPACDDCFMCGDCCTCPPEKPWALLALTWGTVLLGVLCYGFGAMGFTSGWAFLAGAALWCACFFLIPSGWAGVALILGGFLAFDWATPDRLDPSFAAGVYAPMFLGGLIGGTWLLTVLYRLRRDAKDTNYEVQSEASMGLELLESYLDGHNTPAATAPRKIIGLSGYAGVGKDTAAAELMFNMDPEYTRVSFADPIRALGLAVNQDLAIKPGEFGYERFAVLDGATVVVSMEEILKGFDGDWTQAKKVPAVRKYLQGLGVGVRDVLGESTWVDTAMRKLPDGPIVVTDCRFPNEAQAIKDAGGYVVRIHRPGVTAANAHITDTALDDWDFDAHLINEETPVEARLQMRRIEEVLYDPDLAAPST